MSNIIVPARVEYAAQPVLTTEQLAEFYGCEPRRVAENFKRNEERFTVGKHYFKLEGDELKNFKNYYANCVSVGLRAPALYLWTKQGAARHAKMLSTETAWAVFEELEENYFSGKAATVAPVATPDVAQLLFNPDAIIEMCQHWKADRDEKERLQAENGELKETVATQKTQIAEMEPRATYCKLILNCPDTVSISKIAKDYGMSAIEMNKLLHELGVQYRQGKIWLPYQKYAQLGWTQTKTHNYINDGEFHAKVHTYWTQEGRLGLYGVLKQKGYLPLIEQHEEDSESAEVALF